jgi:hypothetical protein
MIVLTIIFFCKSYYFFYIHIDNDYQLEYNHCINDNDYHFTIWRDKNYDIR